MATPAAPHPQHRVAQIMEFYANGLSFQEIANKLSADEYPITRSAVCGVIYRKKNISRPPTIKHVGLGNLGKKTQIDGAAKKKGTQRYVCFSATTLPGDSFAPQSGANLGRVGGIGIMGLATTSCRWPMWNNTDRPKDPKYCGEPKEMGAYCSEHATIAYTPAQAIQPPRGA